MYTLNNEINIFSICARVHSSIILKTYSRYIPNIPIILIPLGSSCQSLSRRRKILSHHIATNAYIR